MRWLLSFVLGMVVGAGALFAWLRQVPHDAPPVVSASGGALPAPPPAAAPAPLAGQLPPPPAVEPRVTEADLQPAPAADDTLARVPALPAPGAPAAKLLVPVEGVQPGQLTDTYNQPRGKERRHEALDIMAPRGTRVLAAADGKVAKLFTSKAGGLTVYEFDPGATHAYYYAHLERYADGLKEGMQLKRGDLIGYVGSSGDASPDAPHLHFAVFVLTPEKQWWKGTPINPFPLLVD